MDGRYVKKPVSFLFRTTLRSILFIMAMMATIGLLSLVLPKPTYSAQEKRLLATMPELTLSALLDGTYFQGFEAHYADTFPFREELIQLGIWMDSLRGMRGEGAVKIYRPNSQNAVPESIPVNAPLPTESNSSVSDVSGSQIKEEDLSQSQISQRPPAPQVPDGYLTEGCFVGGGRACYLFGGNRTVVQQYTKVISNFANRVGEGVQVYNIVVPTSGEFYLPQKYRQMSVSQEDNIRYLYNLYQEQGSCVIPVDAYGWLARHAEEYIYFRTDHHWTALGAYQAYQAFCSQAGLAPIALEELEKKTIPNFWGTLYAETRDTTLAATPDYVDYYITATNYQAYMTTKEQLDIRHPVPAWATFANGGNAYSVFLYGDQPLFEMDNLDLQNGSRVLVLKESYGNAFAPYLMANYDQVYVIDYRYYEKSIYDFVVEKQIDTVIFINNSFAANTSYHTQRIDYLANQL